MAEKRGFICRQEKMYARTVFERNNMNMKERRLC